MQNIFDKITPEMIRVLPDDFEKFSPYCENSITEAEIKKVKHKALISSILHMQRFQLGFSIPIKEVHVSEDIEFHRTEFLALFRSLKEEYITIASQLPEALEFLSPLWADDFSDEEIMYITQNAQNVLDTSDPPVISEEESKTRREEFIKKGYTVNESF